MIDWSYSVGVKDEFDLISGRIAQRDDLEMFSPDRVVVKADSPDDAEAIVRDALEGIPVRITGAIPRPSKT